MNYQLTISGTPDELSDALKALKGIGSSPEPETRGGRGRSRDEAEEKEKEEEEPKGRGRASRSLSKDKDEEPKGRSSRSGGRGKEKEEDNVKDLYKDEPRRGRRDEEDDEDGDKKVTLNLINTVAKAKVKAGLKDEYRDLLDDWKIDGPDQLKERDFEEFYEDLKKLK